MKKIRMMLPVMAVVFAVGGAIGGNLFAPISAYYVASATVCSAGTTEQNNCQLSDDTLYPICTIKVGPLHKQAFFNNDCTGVLRNKPQ
ncbi:MAG: DUF6520 family protein [Bacteroidota bacterium]